MLHDELRRRPVPAADLEDAGARRHNDLGHIAGTDRLHGQFRDADVHRRGNRVEHLARLLSDTGDQTGHGDTPGRPADKNPTLHFASRVPQFQRSRYLSSRPATPKIRSTPAWISKMSANISAAL